MSRTQLETVADAMTRRLVTVTEYDVLEDLDDAMRRLRVRHLPVIDREGKLVGLLSHPDLLRAPSGAGQAQPSAAINQTPVGQIMQREVLTVQPTDPLIEAGKLMWESKVGCLPVVQADGALVGIITEADFIAIAVELLGGQIKKSDVEELARARPRLAV